MFNRATPRRHNALQGKYKANTRQMHGKYKANTWQIQGKYKANTRAKIL